MTSRQRNRQRINETASTPNITWSFLKTATENYTLASVQLNQTTQALDLDNAFDFLSNWRKSDSNLNLILAYYKLEPAVLYDLIPTYTYTYKVFEIIGVGRNASNSNYFNVPGFITFNYYSYEVQNLFVPGKSIDEKYLGLDEHQIYGPRTTTVLTDHSPEHVIITMLDNPMTPIQVRTVEMVDGWPALLLIICSGALSFFLYFYRLIHLLGVGSHIPFDPHLEIFHSALTGYNTNPANSLLFKMQETDLVMVYRTRQSQIAIKSGSCQSQWPFCRLPITSWCNRQSVFLPAFYQKNTVCNLFFVCFYNCNIGFSFLLDLKNAYITVQHFFHFYP